MRDYITTCALPRVHGRVYHLNIGVEMFAPDIIIVGDPDRVSEIRSQFLTDIEGEECHRGLRTVTGRVRASGRRVMVTTSGMGTPSLEIVLNELVALNEVDLVTGKRRNHFEPINIIRVGTSGALQSDTPLGSLIVTEFAVGLDNTGMFYELAADEELRALEERATRAITASMPQTSRFYGAIHPYAARAEREVTAALLRHCEHPVRGVTVSNSGFFANQGRDVSRILPSLPEVDRVFARLEAGIAGLRFENMEMEASFLLHLMGGLGHRAGAVCVAVANRADNTFAANAREQVQKATEGALNALAALRKEA
jgi:uridine phosphorylase